MIFKGIFRSLSESDVEYPVGIREMKRSPLILIKKDGTIDWGNNRGDKDEIINAFDEQNDLLLFVWAGQWRSNVFQLTKAEIKKHYY